MPAYPASWPGRNGIRGRGVGAVLDRASAQSWAARHVVRVLLCDWGRWFGLIWTDNRVPRQDCPSSAKRHTIISSTRAARFPTNREGSSSQPLLQSSVRFRTRLAACSPGTASTGQVLCRLCCPSTHEVAARGLERAGESDNFVLVDVLDEHAGQPRAEHFDRAEHHAGLVAHLADGI